MKLFYAAPSPFARRVRVLLRERGLLPSVQEVVVSPFDSTPELLAVNPASKVPALLLADGTSLVESHLIAIHLDGMGDAPALLPAARMTADLQLWGQAEALTMAAWHIVIEGRREEALRSATWLARQHAAVARCLAAVATTPLPPPGFNYAHTVLACALGYLDFRLPQIDWRREQNSLALWFAEVSARPSMLQTQAT
jgi:glutathione S-transferase